VLTGDLAKRIARPDGVGYWHARDFNILPINETSRSFALWRSVFSGANFGARHPAKDLVNVIKESKRSFDLEVMRDARPRVASS
jgi:hypothetical protein